MTRAPLGLLLLASLLLAACSSPATQTPSTGAPSGAPSTTASTPPASVEPTQQLPSQSETAWFRIWNGVPDSFPVPVDASEADPLQGPVSGAWAVPAAAVSAPALAGYYRDALDEIGWGTILDGPLEDGSFTVYTSNGYGCETLTTILPRGDESLITVLFGAGCPFR